MQILFPVVLSALMPVTRATITLLTAKVVKVVITLIEAFVLPVL